MADLDKFYRRIDQGITYQSDEGIAPSVDRLLQGYADYWISPVPKKIRIKKRLVIADWSAAGWSPEKITRVQHAIAEKMAEGFEVSLWQQQSAVTLSKSQLSILESQYVRDNLMPDPYNLKQLAENAARQYDITYDDICVIDDVMELLSEGTTPPPRSLRMQDWIVLPDDRKKHILKLIETSQLSFDDILIDEDSKQSDIALREVESLIDQKIERYETAHLSETRLAAYVSYEEENPWSLLKTLKFVFQDDEETIDWNHFVSFIRKTPQLKIIDCNWGHFTAASIPESIELPPLDYLEEITTLTCDTPLFQTLCHHYKGLKRIRINLSLKKDGHFFALTAEDLPHLAALETLKLKLPSADAAEIDFFLKTLAKATPRLKKLQIFTSDRHPILWDKMTYFSHCPLEEIILNAPMTIEKFISIGKTFLKLKHIQGKELAPPGSFTELRPNGLPCLKSIHTDDNSYLSELELSALFRAAPNLKDINADLDCDAFVNAMPAHPTFEKLTLTNGTIEHLGILLRRCPTLKKLTLSKPRHVSDERFMLTPDQILAIEELSILYSTISCHNLSQLCCAAPRLKRLLLIAGKNLHGSLHLPPNSLNCLENIVLSCSNITLENLKILLQAAPNLKRISLYECISLTGKLDLPPNSLKHLSRINTEGVLSEENRRILQQAAPRATIIGSLPETQTATVPSNPSTDTPPTSPTQTPSPEPIVADTPHSHKQFEEYDPREEPFQYGTKHATIKNQGAIIRQLSQYLTLTQQHLAAVPKIQKGICNALSYYFIAHEETYDEWLRTVLAWDGSLRTLTTTMRAQFDKLYTYVTRYQFTSLDSNSMYLGEALAEFLNTQKKPCVLTNPWHAIVVSPPTASKTDWTVYDPNFVDGPRKVTPKELLSVIHTTMGRCVAVESNEPLLPRIGDKASFLEEGGLLSLCYNHNQQALLSQLLPLGDLPPSALEGLLLRDTKGISAWVRGLRNNTDIHKLTIELLQQFITKQPTDYKAHLQKSMEFLTPLERHELRCALTPADIAQLPALSPIILETTHTRYAEQCLTTWEKKERLILNPKTYYQECINGTEKKRLIECLSERDVEALRYDLEAHCHGVSRPVFYINSPNDLRCSSAYMHRHGDNRGEIRNGPGGPLFDFLTAHANGVIIVNYDHFNAEELVRFNTLIDSQQRVADGTAVPTKTVIIGLRNVQNPIQPGSDFFSRFNVTENCPISTGQLAESIPPLPPVAVPSADDYAINLYEAPDWKERLQGRWIPDKHGGWQYLEGALQRALREGARVINIQNGPWNDSEFCRFCRNVRLPNGTSLVQSTNDALLHHHVQQAAELTAASVALSPTHLGHFFHRYDVQANKSLQRIDGHIAAAKGRALPVHVTHSLSRSEWAMLLDECAVHNVTLSVSVAPAVTLPPELGTPTPVLPTPINTTTTVIQSTDVDTTLAELRPNVIIQVSECHESDLLSRTDTKLIAGADTETPHFEFTKVVCAVKNALQEGQHVALTGLITPALAEELAPFLLSRYQDASPTGQLSIVSDNASSLHYLPMQTKLVTTDDKKAVLQVDFDPLPTELLRLIEQEPLHLLRAKGRFLRHNPGKTLADWDALRELSDDKARQTSADDFIADRRTMINSVLEREPYVFLSGLSGTGKSTFVQHKLCQPGDTPPYQGLSQLLAWATDTTPGRKLLFLDEANLNDSDWTLFADLFNSPPSILIKGQRYPLTDQHKVIFAGNPLSYQGGRKHAAFFKQYDHHNTVEFKPLPSAVLQEIILAPVFAGLSLPKASVDTITQHFLDVYQFVCDSTTTDVLISPRELQMMALLTVSYAKQHHAEDRLPELAHYFAHHIAQPLVPQNRQQAFANAFPTTVLQPKHALSETSFINVPSRATVAVLLEEILALQAERKSCADNPAWHHGGIACLILEGEPGIGKSLQVIAALKDQGYDDAVTAPKRYYVMPASLSEDEQEKRLRDAFHQGMVVVIDEINSTGSARREALLNALLMGETPEGETAKKPGFTVIGTQNPITLPGRRKPSTALARRTITVSLPAYEPKEMENILAAQGLPDITAKELIDVYIKQRRFAEQHHKHPVPTFRDLEQLAKTIIEAHHNISQMKVEQEPIHDETKEQDPPQEQPKDAPIHTLINAYRAIQQLPSWHPKRFFFPLQLGKILSQLTTESFSTHNTQSVIAAFANVSPFKKWCYRCLKTFANSELITKQHTITAEKLSAETTITHTTMSTTQQKMPYNDTAHPASYKGVLNTSSQKPKKPPETQQTHRPN